MKNCFNLFIRHSFQQGCEECDIPGWCIYLLISFLLFAGAWAITVSMHQMFQIGLQSSLYWKHCTSLSPVSHVYTHKISCIKYKTLRWNNIQILQCAFHRTHSCLLDYHKHAWLPLVWHRVLWKSMEYCVQVLLRCASVEYSWLVAKL